MDTNLTTNPRLLAKALEPLRFRTGKLRVNSRGLAVGELWVSTATREFPSPHWNDFPLVVTGWLCDALTTLALAESVTTVRFMDGRPMADDVISTLANQVIEGEVDPADLDRLLLSRLADTPTYPDDPAFLELLNELEVIRYTTDGDARRSALARALLRIPEPLRSMLTAVPATAELRGILRTAFPTPIPPSLVRPVARVLLDHAPESAVARLIEEAAGLRAGVAQDETYAATAVSRSAPEVLQAATLLDRAGLADWAARTEPGPGNRDDLADPSP